ncbi:MerR family transcriptional regulator [Williamsia muralis]|uniref:MerR family transcriptional regulator n=1 Tax=Williamsia marianensis TaxID=85044 RepID=UPI000DE65A23|nr:MerR family transcriptional regulator [Williamsia marianensis]PVY29006.1 DNA-binding transcriptional MerR regulator [Williamsia marianensis]
MDHPIGEIARSSGVTPRTLRHYEQIGLLLPSRTGAGGIRYYDSAAVVRLQRILILRESGLSLPRIADVLAGQQDPRTALGELLTTLRSRRDSIDAQVSSVEHTITHLEKGLDIMPTDAFAGFDHAVHREEVESRWGADAYATSDRWYCSLTDEQRADFAAEHRAIAAQWIELTDAGEDPSGERARHVAGRHLEWLALSGATVSADYVRGLGQMYVDDERFGKNYAPPGVDHRRYAEFVRDALEFAVD